VVDAKTMQVRALIGSADYWDVGIKGQVNGTQAKRSPGSTLKPFIHALALDQGLLHPRTVLADTPVSYSPYSPENFDSRFLDPVSAQEALIRSRNIPALYLMFEPFVLSPSASLWRALSKHTHILTGSRRTGVKTSLGRINKSLITSATTFYESPTVKAIRLRKNYELRFPHEYGLFINGLDDCLEKTQYNDAININISRYLLHKPSLFLSLGCGLHRTI
jgi:Penicillin binding protein transpeptidase domain